MPVIRKTPAAPAGDEIRLPATPEEVQAFAAQARKASELLKALSHETRLLILCLLADGERSVSDLERMLTLPQAAVSQQLARLRADNLVTTRRDGRMIYYRIADAEVATIITTLHELFCSPVLDRR
jgi:DNA-binding transcriptional ArsR family regulator